MPHPFYGKRLSRLSVTDIRQLLADEPPDQATLEKLLRDPRAGVQAIARSYQVKQKRKDRLESHYDEMCAFERKFRVEGACVVAGIDEAGRGPLAGPVAVGCVALPGDVRFPGLDDSKKMTPKTREEMYERIVSEAKAWSVAVIDHFDIDELGIHGAVMKGMRQAADALALRPDIALVDGKSLPGLSCRERAIVDGDALCLSIAAASVIAKVTRDRIMVELDSRYPGYGFAGHKGYACNEHIEAIRKLGPSDIHRFSFHTATSEAPAGTVRVALERRLRGVGVFADLERVANGIARNYQFFSEEDLYYLRRVYRECRER
ncbi:MAG: ribonuclease HII, partial [Candidatus Latescibacterota bacterium]